jgi:hypothetical protein
MFPAREAYPHWESMMPESSPYRALIDSRVSECHVQSTTLRIWLSALSPANFLLVVGSALLSLVAGASILVKSGIISPLAAAILALISSALTLIHHVLGCDAHQAECRKLKALYDGLRIKYERMELESDASKLKRQIDQLDERRADISETTKVITPAWCERVARRRVGWRED